MQYILGGRRSGKTQRLIELAEVYKAYIVVPNHAMAQMVMQQAIKTGHHILFPITVHELMRSRNTGFVTNLFMDNADIILDQICHTQGWQLQGVSMNIEGLKELKEGTDKKEPSTVSKEKDYRAGYEDGFRDAVAKVNEKLNAELSKFFFGPDARGDGE